MINTIDYKITKIEKKAAVTKTVTTWESVDESGIHHNSSDSYDTQLSTYVCYENGDTDVIEADLELLEGWMVRFFYLDNGIYCKVCLENNLILFAKDIPDLIGTVIDFDKNPFFRDYISPIENKTKIDDTLFFEYKIPDIEEFVLYAKEKKVINSEKISVIDKSGKTLINTRLYYEDNSSELFENKELAVLPGWHIRDIYYHKKDKEPKLQMRIIFENRTILFKTDFPSNAYQFATNLKYFPMKMKANNKEESVKVPCNFFIFAFFVLLAVCIYFLGQPIDNYHPVSLIEALVDFFSFNKVPFSISLSAYGIITSLLFIPIISKFKKKKIKAISEKVDNDYDKWKKENATILRKVYYDYIKLGNLEDETKK